MSKCNFYMSKQYLNSLGGQLTRHEWLQERSSAYRHFSQENEESTKMWTCLGRFEFTLSFFQIGWRQTSFGLRLCPSLIQLL